MSGKGKTLRTQEQQLLLYSLKYFEQKKENEEPILPLSAVQKVIIMKLQLTAMKVPVFCLILIVAMVYSTGVCNPIKADMNRAGDIGLDIAPPNLPLPELPQADLSIPNLAGGSVSVTV
ncbi:hypothetical protein ILUMI_03693 [Ignelater luminosus]|uniref:Uncharacterized protein n=1 Tax=Ignelater luminosus TaxID=2038154 RepID=A0A8K0DE15_IGNLU|nr:hypothetical protein ILUMI_03693 [Ignelater luminosus]